MFVPYLIFKHITDLWCSRGAMDHGKAVAQRRLSDRFSSKTTEGKRRISFLDGESAVSLRFVMP